jgi:diguanylate cyclase (GGDEF)-like protein
MTNIHRYTVLAIGLFTSALICYLDYKTGPNISVLILYFVPVLFVLWYAGSLSGMALTIVSVSAWIAIDRFVRHPHAPLLLADWNWFRGALFVLLTFLLSLWKSLLDQQHLLANEDPLTGLANRRSLKEYAMREIQRATRYHQPLAIAFLDIDNFKQFNDLRGHAEGDKLLIKLGEELRANLRSIDMAARVGGDEFVILFPQVGPVACRGAIEKLHRKLMDSVREHQWPVSFSMGAVSYLESPPSVDVMLQRADERMYKVKQMGKAGWDFEIFTTS